MSKERLSVLGGLSLLLLFSGLFASNMVFQRTITFTADDPGGPGLGDEADGTNTLSLPYNTSLVTLGDLGDDIGGFACNSAGPVVRIEEYVKSSAGAVNYDGCFGVDPAILPERSYRVKVNTQVDYTIIGSHNPGKVVLVTGPTGGVVDGTNVLAWPPHAKANTANKLGIEAGNFKCRNPNYKVLFVQVYRKAGAGIDIYDGCFGTSGGFPLVPGDGYRIKMDVDVDFSPTHR